MIDQNYFLSILYALFAAVGLVGGIVGVITWADLRRKRYLIEYLNRRLSRGKNGK
jgi:ABC-type transporter Mla maintaining outer membrane lipid asymmetry permease subunit MlaE